LDTIIIDELKEKLGLQIKTDLDIFIFFDRQVPENLQLCMLRQLMIWIIEDDLHLSIRMEKHVNIF
jgi:hypothetical protein